MQAEQCLKDGRPDEALARLQDEVRREPANAKLRVFLFQLLAVEGQWDRALNQLNVAAQLDPGALAMAQTYREALRCEALRAEVFAGRRSPLVLGEPEPWMALLLQALRLVAEGRFGEALELRDHAFEAAPATAGSLDDRPFEWVADADPRLGPVLELVLGDRYCWVPFHRLREVRFEAPADLRDLVWAPAQLLWANGGEAVALVPARYPGSEKNPDGAVRLARRTDWTEPAPGWSFGAGQRMLATDAGEVPLLEVRLLRLSEDEGQHAGAASA